MHKFFIFLYFLVACPLLVSAQEKQAAQACKTENRTNIFGTPFCCSRKTGLKYKEKKIKCTEIMDQKDLEEREALTVSVTILDKGDISLDPAKDIIEYQQGLPKLSAKELSSPETVEKFYRCKNKNSAVFLRQRPEYYASVTQFYPKIEILMDLDTEAEIDEVQNAIFHYLCNSFDPLSFFQTLNAPEPPQVLKTQTNNQPSKPKKLENATLSAKNKTARSTQAERMQNNPKSQPRAGRNQTAQPVQPAKKGWPLLGLQFYPAAVPGNFKQVRRFTTKDGQVEIKINFTSSDKSAFYQKLQIKYDGQLTQGTECNDGSRLLETAVNGLYQAYLLKPNAILVLTFGYPPQTASPFLPREKRLQLCAADLSTVW